MSRRQMLSEAQDGTRVRYNRGELNKRDGLEARKIAARIPPYAPNDGFDLCALTST